MPTFFPNILLLISAPIGRQISAEPYTGTFSLRLEMKLLVIHSKGALLFFPLKAAAIPQPCSQFIP